MFAPRPNASYSSSSRNFVDLYNRIRLEAARRVVYTMVCTNTTHSVGESQKSSLHPLYTNKTLWRKVVPVCYSRLTAAWRDGSEIGWLCTNYILDTDATTIVVLHIIRYRSIRQLLPSRQLRPQLVFKLYI